MLIIYLFLLSLSSCLLYKKGDLFDPNQSNDIDAGTFQQKNYT